MQLNFMLCADNNYLKYVKTLLISILHHHKENKVNIFIVHSEVIENNIIIQLKSLTSLFINASINFIPIDNSMTQGLFSFYRYPVSVYYRILAIELIPSHIEDIIYLDIDTLVTRNLTDLMYTVEKAPLAACYDIQAKLQNAIYEQNQAIGAEDDHCYFNSGVLYMNLSYIPLYIYNLFYNPLFYLMYILYFLVSE